MKYFQLFRKEPKLLSNKKLDLNFILIHGTPKFWWLGVILISLLSSCGDKKDDEQKPIFYFTDSAMVSSETKKVLGNDINFIAVGNFDEDSLQEVAAGIEFAENNNWGIKFFLLELENNKLVKKYETALLDGSFKESFVKKIKFPKFNHELLYYNSQDYFWGTGGGEVFAYIVNFASKETYYAHLFSVSRRRLELFLSKNISEPDLKKFFVSTFKKDYPELNLASEDVSLEY